MKYYKFILLTQEEVDTDDLGNSIMENRVIADIDGRFSPWSMEDIELLGREVTKINRKILIKSNHDAVKNAKYICLASNSDIVYTITELIDLERWQLLVVKVVKL